MLKPNRLYSAVKIAGTESFRLASSKFLDVYGRNSQNLSDTERRIIIPAEGNAFVQTDQSGAEALICAYLFEDGRFRELFKQGIKPHSYAALNIFTEHFSKEFPNAQKILDSPIAQVPKYPEFKALFKAIKGHDIYYYLGKKTIHASDYNQGAATFSKSIMVETQGKIIIPVKDSKLFLAKHHGKFPEIHGYHYSVQAKIRRDRTLCNLFGFPRVFYGPLSDDVFREAYAFIPQSTVGTITNIACTELYDFIKAERLPWTLVNNCHDSYMVECPVGDVRACAAEMQKHIERDLRSPRGESFKMKSETTVGFNWGSFHPTENPKGMRDLDVFLSESKL